jgi:hypothetical protein
VRSAVTCVDTSAGSMTAKLAELLVEATRLEDEIAERSIRFKEVKAELVDLAGETDQAFDVDGRKVSIVFPKPKLVSSLSLELLGKLKELVGRKFNRLFVASFKPVSKNFRENAFKLLEKEVAKKVIDLVEEVSSPRVTIGKPAAE